MRVLVCGDRNWTDTTSIMNALYLLKKKHKHLIVINGGARGADTLGNECARELKLGTVQYLADWNKYGKSAGPIRNQQMLKEGKPDLVLAFHPDLSKSKGTKHMVEIARKAGVEVIVFNE